MGMSVKCPGCGYTASGDNHRGARIGNCPECGTQLQGRTAGLAKGRYICPVSGGVITLGLRGIQLDQPHVLEWVPGTAAWGGYQPEPRHDFEKEILSNALGKVFGPGCVISDWFQPGREGPGLRLIPVPLEDANPETWITNEPVSYKKCAACSARVVAGENSRMDHEWTPARDWYWAGRNNRSRHTVDTDKGPHPAGTYACPACRSAESEDTP
jgi:hypothetical protein